MLVNNAGQWFGKIIGADPGATYAGSSGTEFVLDDAGNVIAITNDGNGAGSTNTTTADTSTTNTTTQTNTASLTNNISIDANTGGNDLKGNTGGSNTVTTGDANVILNVLNFVNNNFSGGQVVFTLVNVFGSWIGNVITPSAQNQPTAPTSPEAVSGPDSPAIGGPSVSITSPSDTAASALATSSVSKPKKSYAGSLLGIFSSPGTPDSQIADPSQHVYEDTYLQIPASHPWSSLGATLDIRWLYTALAASILIYFIRRPAALRRLGTFLGLF